MVSAARRRVLLVEDDPDQFDAIAYALDAAGYLVEEAAAAVREVAPPDVDVQVELVWDPPWTPERMSEAAQKKFGWS